MRTLGKLGGYVLRAVCVFVSVLGLVCLTHR